MILSARYEDEIKSPVSRWQFSARELLLFTAVVALIIYGIMTSSKAARIKKTLLALIPSCEIRTYFPDPEDLHALGGRFQHTGVIRFPFGAAIPDKLNVRSYLKDPVSSERLTEFTGIIGRQADEGVYFTIELPTPKQLPTRPKVPGTYIYVIEAFDGETRIAMVATPMNFVVSP